MIDVEALELPVKRPEVPTDCTKARARQRGELFLRGPIPFRWLLQARNHGLLALAVGLLVWFERGCRNGTEDLTISESRMKSFGLCRQTFAIGLSKLEMAGLTVVERNPGRKPRISLIVGE